MSLCVPTVPQPAAAHPTDRAPVSLSLLELPSITSSGSGSGAEARTAYQAGHLRRRGRRGPRRALRGLTSPHIWATAIRTTPKYTTHRGRAGSLAHREAQEQPEFSCRAQWQPAGPRTSRTAQLSGQTGTAMAPAAAALSASEVEVPIASPVSVDVCSSLDARRRTPHAHIDRQYIVWTDRDRKRVTIPVVELPAARCTSPAAHITDGEIPDPLAFAFA